MQEIKIVALTLYRGPPMPQIDILAHIDLTIGDDLLLRGCALANTDDGYLVFPPKGRKSGEVPVGWRRKGPLAKAINEAAIRSFEAMTGEGLD